MKQIDVIAAVLVVVGALNWGLVAVARFDLVAALFGMQFGEVSAASALVYGLVGLAGLYQAVSWKRVQNRWAQPQRSRLVSSSTRNSITEQRQMKKMIAGIVAAMTITGAAANMGAATADKDIVDTAVAAGSFKTLAKALQAADLVETLKGAGPFTVFAPTDEAFAKLPAGTLDALLKPENKPKLQRILTSHVVAGKVMAADVVKTSSAKAVSGDTLTIASRDGGVTVDGAKVVKTDIAATNGVIHVIDSVILPKDE